MLKGIKKWAKRQVCKRLGHKWQRFDYLISPEHITIHIICGRCVTTRVVDKANDSNERLWGFTDYLIG